jgi:hypothetical protein
MLSFWQVSEFRHGSCIAFTSNVQANQKLYPTIFLLAMDIIPIQASSVPCERVFSSAKETMASRRNRISHELMEDLQVLKFAAQKGQLLNFTAGLGEDEELTEMERNADLHKQAPEDINAFIRRVKETHIN